MLNRRAFLELAALSPVLAAAAGKKVPVGLELFSVRNELMKDLEGTVTKVAKMGYECVEFYAPYYEWTPAKAKEMRKLMDDQGIRCYSTHNSAKVYEPGNLDHAIELNKILGSRYIVMASAGGKIETLEGWKQVAEKLKAGPAKMRSAGLKAGFHNHHVEFIPIGGTRPMDVLAKNTDKAVTLQLDVGTCLHAGADPVEWIRKNPGRITSMHCKDWGPDKGYEVLFGEGKAPWKQIFDAAEKSGGIEFYLIEQEGSQYSQFETVERCLAAYKQLRSS